MFNISIIDKIAHVKYYKVVGCNNAVLERRMNMSEYVTNTSDKKRLVALLLCIFLGEFGIHRFYVGKIGTGILYLLTGGLFGIGWIIDIVKICLGSFTDNVDAPLREW